MTLFHSLILGIVEGITEFLPISSTGHLILISQLLNITQDNFTKSFEIIIQLGAILSVIVLYWQEFFNFEKLKRIVVGFLPTAIIGLVFYKLVKTHFIGNQEVVLLALFFGGIALIVFELFYKESKEAISDISQITYKQSIIIGLFQSIAIIPGVSRSAATILGGLLIGLSRKTIVEFSFLLAVPTMIAASGLDFIKNANSFSTDQFGILIFGFTVSFFVAFASIKFLISFIKEHNFVSFGVYRILLVVIFWIVIIK